VSRYTDVGIKDIISMTGWDDESVISLYSEFVKQHKLEDEFEEFCRDAAEEELDLEERMQDEEVEWEKAGGPICPQCCGVYKGEWNKAHKMDCSIGRTPLNKLRDVADYIPEGEYRDRVQRYLDEIPFEEDE